MVNEAIKTLKHHYEYLRRSWKPYPDQKVLDAIVTAVSALEKQIPKKPRKTNDYCGIFKKTYYFSCPKCGNAYLTKEMDERNDTRYCWHCGQAIDWSGNVEEKTEEK